MMKWAYLFVACLDTTAFLFEFEGGAIDAILAGLAVFFFGLFVNEIPS